MNVLLDRSVARPPEPALDVLPTRWSRSWAVVVLASTVAVSVVSLAGAPEVVRSPITVWFIAICPGMAIVRLLRLDEPVAELMLAFALSLALAGLIPSIFLYLGAWSPAWSLTALVAIAAVGLCLDPVIVPRQGWNSMGRAIRARVLVFAGRAEPAVSMARPLAPQPNRSGQPSIEPRRGPPMVVITRLPQASPRSAPDRLGIGAGAAGHDELPEEEPSVALRSAFDRVIGDIAERRLEDD